jgi:hypothetical protein
MGAPHPCTSFVGGKDWRTTFKARDWCRDDSRAPKRTHSETEKKDRKVRLYGRPMITRTRSLPRKSHKLRSIMNSYRPIGSN